MPLPLPYLNLTLKQFHSLPPPYQASNIMKMHTLSAALTLLTSLALAAPAPVDVSARQVFEASFVFYGASPASYEQSFPTDDTVTAISMSPLLPILLLWPQHQPVRGQSIHIADLIFIVDNPLSVSSIQAIGGAVCTFFGADGSSTFIYGEQTVDVSPPQPQTSGICDSE